MVEGKCANPACSFFAHSQPGFDGFCCKKCQWCSTNQAGKFPQHGAQCERRATVVGVPGARREPKPPHPARGAEEVGSAPAAGGGPGGGAPAHPEPPLVAAGLAEVGGQDAPSTAGSQLPERGPSRSGGAHVFDGRWTDEEGLAIRIEGSVLYTPDGSGTQLTLEGSTSCSFTIDGEVFTGRLSEEDRLEWNDGALWFRSAPATASSALPEDRGCSLDTALERRCDPGAGDWLTFKELSERYAVDGYRDEDLRQYWEEECVAEMRWDVDGQACSWLDFQQKYLSKCAAEELRRRWLRCPWLEDSYAETASGPVGSGPKEILESLYRPGPPEADQVVAPDLAGTNDATEGGQDVGGSLAPPSSTALAVRAKPQRDPYEETARWLDGWGDAADRAGFERGSLATLPSSAFVD